MTDLTAGTRVQALDWPPAVWTSDSTAQTDVSSTTFTPGSPVVAVTVMAPTSGRVRVDVSGGIRDDIGDNRGVLAFEVYEGADGSGEKIVAADSRTNGMSSIGVASNYQFHGRGALVEGLTPGGLYYVRTVHAVPAGSTVDILHRSLIVYPVS